MASATNGIFMDDRIMNVAFLTSLTQLFSSTLLLPIPSLQYRCILSAQVYIFVLGHHLGFGNCGGFGTRKNEGVRVKWKKWERGRGRKEKYALF